MKTIKKPIKIDEVFPISKSQAIIEGNLVLPSGKPDIAEILLVEGKASTMSAEAVDGKVLLDGTVTLSVIYIGKDSGIYSFDSVSAYKHSVSIIGIKQNMRVDVTANLKEVDYSDTDIRTVNVKGIVEIETKVFGIKTKSYVADVHDDEVMLKNKSEKMRYMVDEVKDSMTYREDIRIPQNMPPAKDILYCEAYPKIKELVRDDSKCIIEGELSIYLVYLSNDETSPIHYLYDTTEFGKIVHIDGMEEDDSLDCMPYVGEVIAMPVEEEQDIINIEAYISFKIRVTRQMTAEYVEDGYSTKYPIKIEREKSSIRELKVKGCMKAIVRSGIEVPEAMPPVARVLFVKAKSVLSSGYCGQDRVYVEGVMLYTVCYSSSDGVKSMKGEFPFSTEVQIEGFNEDISAEVQTDVEYISFDGAGRSIDLKITLCVTAKGYKTHEIYAVTDIEKGEGELEQIEGMHIYFAEENESYWDIAKKYNTSIEMIEKYNPNEEETRGKKKKVIVF